jgi:hypothetical protein
MIIPNFALHRSTAPAGRGPAAAFQRDSMSPLCVLSNPETPSARNSCETTHHTLKRFGEGRFVAADHHLSPQPNTKTGAEGKCLAAMVFRLKPFMSDQIGRSVSHVFIIYRKVLKTSGLNQWIAVPFPCSDPLTIGELGQLFMDFNFRVNPVRHGSLLLLTRVTFTLRSRMRLLKSPSSPPMAEWSLKLLVAGGNPQP